MINEVIETAIKPWWLRAIPYLIAVAVVAAVLFGAYRHGVSTTNDAWQAKWDKAVAAQALAQSAAERRQREEEQRRQSEIEGVRNEANRQIEQAKADAAAAAVAANSLRDTAKRLAARADKACSNTGIAIGSAPTTGPGVVLADVLERADQRAGELAAAYDRARAAGIACERGYDKVKGDAQ